MVRRRPLLAAPLLAPALAHAQSYPSRPVRIIVGFAAGGSTDVLARAIAPRLQALLGQPIVVENRPGAGGNIATEFVVRAPADGYTLLFGTIGPLAINPTLYGNLPFDPVSDLTPISYVGDVPNILAVPVDKPYRSVAEIVAAARARTDTLTFGSSGVGSAGHLAGEQLNQLTGIRTVHVPYRGGGALMPDLISGKVDYAFTTALNAVPQAEAGRLRLLAVPTARRSRLLPEIPTVAESGVPGFEMSDWAAMCGPRSLPDAVVARLSDAMRGVLTDAELVAAMAARRLEIAPSTPDELGRFLRAEAARLAPIVRASGARPD